MLASIIKRDGTEVPFDSVKILNAITKANQAVGGEDRVEPVLGPRPVDIEFDRGIAVGYGLRFNTLRGINDQQRTLTG